MAKFCVNCGSELIEGAKACGNCGTLIEEVATTDNVEASAPVTNNSVPNNGGNNSAPKKGADIGMIGFIISLVSTILCCGSFNIISLILCIIGLVDHKNNPTNNKGLAIAGIVISSIGLIFAILLYALGLFTSYL